MSNIEPSASCTGITSSVPMGIFRTIRGSLNDPNHLQRRPAFFLGPARRALQRRDVVVLIIAIPGTAQQQSRAVCNLDSIHPVRIPGVINWAFLRPGPPLIVRAQERVRPRPARLSPVYRPKYKVAILYHQGQIRIVETAGNCSKYAHRSRPCVTRIDRQRGVDRWLHSSILYSDKDERQVA
jgi:hypothetical protein